MLIGISLSAEEKKSNVTFNGHFTSWAIAQFDNSYNMQLGGRFVPTLLGNFSVFDKSNFDFEASLNINGSANFSNLNFENGITISTILLAL